MSKRKQTPSSDSSNPAPRDFVAVAIEYAREAIADKRNAQHGKWLRLAAKRFLDDLKRAENPKTSYRFDPTWANNACGFIELLPHVEGSWATPNITLHPSHVFFVVNLFGFRQRSDGTRRFTSALFAVARKNAKSTLAGAILLVCLCLEKEPGPQVISAATTGSQARIVFNVARRMVEKTASLREAYTLEAFANAIARYDIGGTCKPINAKASTQDGLNPSVCALDEIHAHKNHDLLNVLRSAAGARRSPLFLYTTTEGYENPGPWAELRKFAQQLLDEVVAGDHFLAVIYAVDEKDDDFSEAAWVKANPLMSVNPYLAAEIRKEAIEARAMPGRLAEFRIKRLNRRASSAEAWVNLTKWKKCAGPVDLDAMQGAPCWAALDLASTTDMNAWRLLWQLDDHWYTWGRYWVPSTAATQRSAQGSALYQGYIDGGFVTRTDGDVTDYDQIEREILEDCERFAPRKVAFDPWNAAQIANNLITAGVPMEQFIQGPRSYNPAMKAFERAYAAGNLNHGGDPVLTWNAANLVARQDQNMNLAPDRKRSGEKIDGVVALIMAFGVADAETDGGDAGGFFSNPVIA